MKKIEKIVKVMKSQNFEIDILRFSGGMKKIMKSYQKIEEQKF